MKKKGNKLAFILTISLIVTGLFYAHTRTFLPHDEGWILNPAQRILAGEFPYRDFHYIYTPGLAYLISIGFKMFGMQFIVAKMITMVFSLMSVFFLIKISNFISNKQTSYILPVLFFSAWLPMHINFAWPVVYAIWAGLFTCYLLLLAQKTQLTRFFLFAGITTGLAILFKQNFGVALLLNNIIFLILNRPTITRKDVLMHVGGILFVPALFAMYFAYNNALIPFINDMYFFFYQQFWHANLAATPFIYPDAWYRQILKTIFYLIPILFTIPACVVAWKKNKSIFFLASFTGLYYLLGIRPTTDITHYVPLLSLTGIPFLILVTYLKKNYIKIFLWIMMIGLLFLGIYSALYKNYYRWNTRLIEQSYPNSVPRLGVYTDSGFSQIIPEVTKYIESQTQPNEYIFIYSYSPSYYVLTNRKNPTKFIWLPLPLLSKNDEREISNDLKEKEVKLLLADATLDSKTSILGKFIEKNYQISKKIGPYTFWIKKPNSSM